ncbi:MAG: nucleoside phosphorylase [Butyrivibrio sp.]|nr:nucleoside phosphorylase [Butyrivibrio sp.]
MLYENEFPVLEFDDSQTAKLNPENFISDEKEAKFETDKIVITFFPEVVNKLAAEGRISKERTISGENPVVIYRFTEQPDVLLTLGQVGCPACAGNLDLFHAMGATRVMFCGGGGVLDHNIEVGQILVVDGAIRDDGFSYQYIPPSRVIHTDPEVTDKIRQYLEENHVPHLSGLTWTTDAIFRETADRISSRKTEGAKIVEMEQSGCIAVARFRGFAYGALIYGGDDLSGEEWSGRGWRSREGVRYDLVQLCKELVRII